MRSVPHVGQWCDANTTSASPPHSSSASCMNRDQARGSRTSAPRSVRRLCSVCVAFSAMQSALRSGNQMFISAGASVPGVNWKTMRTPSTVASVPVSDTETVGAARPREPLDVAMPSPQPTWPVGPAGRSMAYM